MANTDVLGLLESIRIRCALAKQQLIADNKTAFQATMVLVASDKSTLDAAVSAATHIDTLQDL